MRRGVRYNIDTYYSASASRLPATSKTASNAKACNAQQSWKKHEENLVETLMYCPYSFIYSSIDLFIYFIFI